MSGYFLSPANTGLDPRRRPPGLSFALQQEAELAEQRLNHEYSGDIPAQRRSPFFVGLPPGVKDLVGNGGMGFMTGPGGQSLGGMPPANTSRGGVPGMLPGLRPQNPGAALNARLARGLSAALGA